MPEVIACESTSNNIIREQEDVMILLAMIVVLQTAETKLDGDQFMRLIKSQQQGLHDIEFVCEGSTVRRFALKAEMEGSPDQQQVRFQGRYAYRSDGAKHMDLYIKELKREKIIERKTIAFIKGKLAMRTLVPDSLSQSPQTSHNSKEASLRFEGSPERFFFHTFWQKLGYSADSIGFTHEGWDEIDGKKVCRIAINEFPKAPAAQGKIMRYWVDFERGGNILKQEYYKNNNLVFRLHDIKLIEVNEMKNRKKIWIPVRAEFDTFLLGREFSKTPVFHESYSVVDGSITVNSGLADARFAISWKAPEAEPTELALTRKEFAAIPLKKGVPSMPNDPVSVQRYQETRLAEADRQAKQLEASSSDGGWTSWFGVMQVALAVVGIATIGVARRLK